MRPQILFPLFAEVSSLKGVGPKTAINLLAAYEVHVGHYYLTRQAYVAAANRGRYVVENFQETPSVGDGLAIMTEAYQRLSLDDLAATSLETLKLNYPDHPRDRKSVV
jgi:outer membrane protein assembly factor BamD